jgi:thioesterase domain-containing protein
MTAGELEQYLHRHIPISAAMGITAVAASPEEVRLRAALAPNVNHRSTAFGGSVASLAVLAGWSVLRVGLDDVTPTPQIVIQRSSMEYTSPIRGDYEAACRRPSAESWRRFMDALERRGRGRLRLVAEVYCDGESAGHMTGEYVALRSD